MGNLNICTIIRKISIGYNILIYELWQILNTDIMVLKKILYI